MTVQIAPVKLSSRSVTSTILRKVEDDLEWAFRLVAKGTSGGPSGVASQLGGLVAATPGDQILRVIPDAAQISRAGRIFDAVLVLTDPLLRRMVYGRAAGNSWRAIRALDPASRDIRHLRRMYAQALGTIWFLRQSAFLEK